MMESRKKIFVNAKFGYTKSMTHSFVELFYILTESEALACLIYRQIGFFESLIFLAKIKKNTRGFKTDRF